MRKETLYESHSRPPPKQKDGSEMMEEIKKAEEFAKKEFNKILQ